MSPSKKRTQESTAIGDEAETKKHKTDVQEFVPRSYQVAVYEVAVRRNTIVVLDTGSGKTVIALMLMKQFAKDLNTSGKSGRIIVFLAPTVPLVNQQYEEIKIKTDLKVRHYHKSSRIEEWSTAFWQREVSTYQVLVMTPQILLEALRKAFLTLDMVRLLILDECHHASGNHPYTRIMKEFYHMTSAKPHVFGMTASPFKRKDLSSVNGCEDQLSELENILDSKIYTLTDRKEMEVFVPTAQDINKYYSKPSIHEDLKRNLESLFNKYIALLVQPESSSSVQYKDPDDINKAAKKQLSNFHTKICFCLDELGLICAHEATKICMEDVRRPYCTDDCNLASRNATHCKYFLEEVLRTIEESLSNGHETLLKTEDGCLEAVELGYISSKLYELTQIFQSFGMSDQVYCLIFVERIITARVIERVIKRFSYLSHFTVSYLTGGSSSVDSLTRKLQKETLDLFRSRKINLLFTTDVAEEGLDIPDCSCVIRFDLPKTVRSFVQSRGRARQVGSRFIMMLERENNQQRDLLFDIIGSYYLMMDTATNRGPEEIGSQKAVERLDEYYVESTGAKVTADSSISLLNRYCQNLPKDKYFIPRPIFRCSPYNGSYQCTLTLPLNAPIQTIVGPVHRNSHMAKQLACLEACKKLHQLRALDDHLLPSVEEPFDNKIAKEVDKSAQGAGTKKRKELHGTTSVHALSGSWALENVDITLQGYKLSFKGDEIDQGYSSFVLLIDAILDQDVACMQMDLYSMDKTIKVCISPCGPIKLNMEQVERAKHFHEIFFNGLFGRLVMGSPRALILKDDSMWKTSKKYMLLPLESSTMENGFIKINWNGIYASATVAKSMMDIYLTKAENGKIVPPCGSSDIEGSTTNMIHLANKSVVSQSLKDKVVLAIHTGRMYTVLNVVDGLSALSPFDGTSDNSPSESLTFAEYFNKTYGLLLQHPGQSLLLLKQSHNPHNLLSSRSNNGDGGAAKQHYSKTSTKKPLAHVHMPPELLLYVDIPYEVVRSFYLLPSLMHRMESLMLASQLRKEVGYHSSESYISISLMLEAITTIRCCEDFSLERLELLGDSVLKYAVSCHLYLKFHKKHEGQLSYRRSKIISNATLHRLGTKRNIQGYIRDSAFDPRGWVAPGQFALHSVPCDCGYVPDKPSYIFDETKIVIGKACERGHRWICSKTISDCVEAVIGAHYVSGGLPAALAVLKWLGINVEVEPEMLEAAIRAASLLNYVPKAIEIKMLESKLSYTFTVKGLLLEAITHASQQEQGAYYCYQRLEFLGDAVLDLLVTWYLFQRYKDIDPGELTDLRSASVNNENFAQVAVRHNLQQYIQHSSELLLEQITDYIKRLEESPNDKYLLLADDSSVGPKVLADIVESIAGAILLDTKVDLKKVWEVFEPLLSPIVTPEELELPPLRELTELCGSRGYFWNSSCTNKGDMVVATLQVQLTDVLLVRKSCEKNRKTAKGQAAALLLKDLEARGLSHSRYASKKKQPQEAIAKETKPVRDSSHLDIYSDISKSSKDTELVESKKMNKTEFNDPVHVAVQMQKGGPRIALFEFCKRWKWPLPSFESAEQKPSDQTTSAEEKKNYPMFLSTIALHIPNYAVIKVAGEMRSDKKSSQDSAALAMLYELMRQGRCTVEELS